MAVHIANRNRHTFSKLSNTTSLNVAPVMCRNLSKGSTLKIKLTLKLLHIDAKGM